MATYKVEGMTCGGCANSVIKAIESVLPGVDVKVDLEHNQVAVAAEADEDTIRGAVEDAGFEFKGPA